MDDALSLFEESVDTLGTSLRLGEELQKFRVLAVTSATSNEGKTSVASQLAISISKATGEKTLLIDGDMRSPDIHRVFGITAEPGLEDVLCEDCSLSDAIYVGWSETLDILPAGRLGANPHRLLSNGVANGLFEQLKDEYRYVIIDTPPVLMAGESLILCQAADATLMCTMCDSTRSDQVPPRLQAVGRGRCAPHRCRAQWYPGQSLRLQLRPLRGAGAVSFECIERVCLAETPSHRDQKAFEIMQIDSNVLTC